MPQGSTFKKKFWVLIKKCEHVGVWYADKVGTLQYVTDELSTPPEHMRYTLVDEPARERGIYSFIEQADAEVITPSLLQRVAHWLNLNPEVKPESNGVS